MLGVLWMTPTASRSRIPWNPFVPGYRRSGAIRTLAISIWSFLRALMIGQARHAASSLSTESLTGEKKRSITPPAVKQMEAGGLGVNPAACRLSHRTGPQTSGKCANVNPDQDSDQRYIDIYSG